MPTARAKKSLPCKGSDFFRCRLSLAEIAPVGAIFYWSFMIMVMMIVPVTGFAGGIFRNFWIFEYSNFLNFPEISGWVGNSLKFSWKFFIKFSWNFISWNFMLQGNFWNFRNSRRFSDENRLWHEISWKSWFFMIENYGFRFNRNLYEIPICELPEFSLRTVALTDPANREQNCLCACGVKYAGALSGCPQNNHLPLPL